MFYVSNEGDEIDKVLVMVISRALSCFIKIMFGSWKILKKKNVKKNNFFMFDCLMKNSKEN